MMAALRYQKEGSRGTDVDTDETIIARLVHGRYGPLDYAGFLHQELSRIAINCEHIMYSLSLHHKLNEQQFLHTARSCKEVLRASLHDIERIKVALLDEITAARTRPAHAPNGTVQGSDLWCWLTDGISAWFKYGGSVEGQMQSHRLKHSLSSLHGKTLPEVIKVLVPSIHGQSFKPSDCSFSRYVAATSSTKSKASKKAKGKGAPSPSPSPRPRAGSYGKGYGTSTRTRRRTGGRELPFIPYGKTAQKLRDLALKNGVDAPADSCGAFQVDHPCDAGNGVCHRLHKCICCGEATNHGGYQNCPAYKSWAQ